MRNLFILAAFALLMVGCSQAPVENTEQVGVSTTDELVAQAKEQIEEINAKDFMALIEAGEPYILVDLRTQPEHDGGHIPGSIHIPRGVLEFRINNESVWENEGMYPPLAEDLIIVYCKKGSRGALASVTLKQLGFTNVKNISGGFLNWISDFPADVDKNEVVGGAVPAAGGGGGGC